VKDAQDSVRSFILYGSRRCWAAAVNVTTEINVLPYRRDLLDTGWGMGVEDPQAMDFRNITFTRLRTNPQTENVSKVR